MSNPSVISSVSREIFITTLQERYVNLCLGSLHSLRSVEMTIEEIMTTRLINNYTSRVKCNKLLTIVNFLLHFDCAKAAALRAGIFINWHKLGGTREIFVL